MRAEVVKCMYCGRQNGPNEGMFVVKEAIKKPYSVNRWERVGYCCDDCEHAGKPVAIDPWRTTKPEQSDTGEKR